MSSSRRGRRVPPKHGARPIPPYGSSAGPAPGAGAEAEGAGMTEAMRRATRSQNRAAKRAAAGVRPKAVRGRVSGRQSRGYSPAVLGLAIAAVVVVAAVFLLGNPLGGGSSASPSPSVSSTDGSPTPAATRALTGCPAQAPAGLPAGEKHDVTISTPKGDIVIEVDASLAPVAAANFIALATCRYFDGVIFHRVIPGFVIQGGDGQYGWTGALDTAKVGQGGPGYEFNDEPVIGEYTRGTVAMANSGANTNGSQFFICQADLTGSLGKNYVIFGHVTSGMDVVDQIINAPRNAQDLPDDPVPMTSVTVAPAPSAAPSTSPAASVPGTSPEAPQP
jgi:cyclophilin family peptidyl-prolyl cis-trans isomerase